MAARPPGTLRLLLRPSMFVLHVSAVLAVVAAVLLGNWQLSAWQLHREDRAAELVDVAPVPLDDVLGADDPFPGDGVGRPVTMSGRWLPGASVLVSGREHDGVDGFWTVVPLLVCQGSQPGCGDAAIPVVLGWSPTEAAAPRPPTGTAEVVGWLQPGEGSAEPDADPGDDVLPALRIADLLQRVDVDLYGGYVILKTPAGARGGAEAVTPASLPEAPTSVGLRNLLYGIEWWFFGGFAVFLWWRWTRDELAVARAGPDGVTSVAGPAQEAEPASEARIPSAP
jgi:surfeit locus 1 family protein